MNSKLIIAAILIVSIGMSVLFMMNRKTVKTSEDQSLWEDYQIVTRTIEGKNLRLVVADTDERRQKGLMHVRKPVQDFDGMIFIFEKKELHTFWNMNTFEDLTLYWMDDEIIAGSSDLPSIEKSKEIVTVSSPKPVNIVVEVIK